MVSSAGEESDLVYGFRLSSVGPANVTGTDVVYEPSSLDQAMRLHYLRQVCYFKMDSTGADYQQPSEQMSLIYKIKETMFYWLNQYFMVNGRFRRSDAGWPFIKCNDCGTRFIEAKSPKTLQDWLHITRESSSLHMSVVPNKIIGPEPLFSPPVLLQFTWFKCGGLALGLSWAHILGDPFTATDFLNMCGLLFSGHKPSPIPSFPKVNYLLPRSDTPAPSQNLPPSLKRVGPVGDNWFGTRNDCKMDTHSFHVSPTQLADLQSQVSSDTAAFELLSAVFWKSIARIRDRTRDGVDTVTVCRKGARKKYSMNNKLVISTASTNSKVAEMGIDEIVKLMGQEAEDEADKIEAAVEGENGLGDFVVYGGNLTFVKLDDAELYGMELKGEKPVYVDYLIDGVAENGAILVLPAVDSVDGRVVKAILPEEEVAQLKMVMKKQWSIV
uniref:Protein ECERIFERUM 26-like n=1 Tax=Kalanchoe fedtschenkoi TaxID=63787 RepID=A0A7N0UQT9_KALFE